MSDTPVVGWYRDPSGRHQHRFWNGGAWTSRVADAGVESSDPPVMGRGGSRPPRRTREPTSTAGRSRRPLAIATAAVLVVGITVAVFVATRHESKQEAATTTTTPRTTTTIARLAGQVAAKGSGHVTVKVGKGQATVRVVHLQAGQTAVVGWRVAAGKAALRVGITATTVDRLADHGFVTPDQRKAALREAESLLEVLPSQAAHNNSLSERDPTIRLPGFEGVALAAPDTVVAPVDGDYAVIVAGEEANTRVELAITVRGDTRVTADLTAEAYNTLIAGPFRDDVNEFVTAFCAANPTKDRGACDRLQHDDDGWPVTGADPAPTTVPNMTDSGLFGTNSDSGAGTTTTSRDSGDSNDSGFGAFS